MGTIAARDCLRVLELTEQTAAATLMAAVQAIHLRVKQGELVLENLNKDVQQFIAAISEQVGFLAIDRRLDHDINTVSQCIKNQHWSLYETD